MKSLGRDCYAIRRRLVRPSTDFFAISLGSLLCFCAPHVPATRLYPTVKQFDASRQRKHGLDHVTENRRLGAVFAAPPAQQRGKALTRRWHADAAAHANQQQLMHVAVPIAGPD